MVNVKKISILLLAIARFFMLSAGDFSPAIYPGYSYSLPPFAANLLRDERKRLEQERTLELEEAVSRVLTQKEAAKKKDEHKPVALSKEMRQYLSGQYEDPIFLSKNVTLTLKDVSVRYAIELIGKTTGFSFLIDPDVSGFIQSLHFKNVPLAIVMRHILRGNRPRLALIKDSGLYRITRLRQAKDIILGNRERDFLCEVIKINSLVLNKHQKVRLEKLWRGIVGEDIGKPGFYMMFDEKSKNVFCRGRSSQVKQFKKFLKAIDTKSHQIKIEARFVCAEKGYEENIGFQWSGIYNRRASIKRGFNFVGVGKPLADINNNPQQQPASSLVDWALNFLPTPDKAAKTIRLPFVFGGNDLNTKRLNLVLNAAEDRNEIKTILKPTVLTNDGEDAEILVGENVPIETIVEESVEGRLRNVTTATYKDIGIQLKVRPIVVAEGRAITLDIFIENSQQSDVLQTGNNTYPIIRTTRSSTRVSLRSGQTTMISGLMKDIKEKYRSKTPYLSSIPFLGWFFQGARRKKQDMQLLIFITPTIV